MLKIGENFYILNWQLFSKKRAFKLSHPFQTPHPNHLNKKNHSKKIPNQIKNHKRISTEMKKNNLKITFHIFHPQENVYFYYSG